MPNGLIFVSYGLIFVSYSTNTGGGVLWHKKPQSGSIQP